MLKTILIAFFVVLSATTLSQNINDNKITVEKIWSEDLFKPETIEMAKSMSDGIRYSLIEEDGTEINIYEYETDNFIQTVFTTRDILVDEDEEPVVIDNYSFNNDETMILIATETEPIYRRSRESVYYAWDIENETLTLLAEGDKQRLATFSDCGEMVAFVRNNNIYVKTLSTKEIMAITDDGVYNEIINGTTDWVYEEEFAFTQGFFWSPDSEKIAYYKFDESRVKEFVMMMYGRLYPEEYRFKYPKAGEENAIVTIHIYDFNTGETLQVGTGDETDQYIPRVQWAKNPEKLAIQRMNRHQNRLEILLADANTGNTELLYQEDNIYYIDITDNLTFLDDKKHFIITGEKDGFNHIYLYDMDGLLVRQITQGKWDVTDFLGIDKDNNLIYYTSREESPFSNHLYAIDIEGNNKKRLTENEGFNSPSFSKGHEFFINRNSTINTPPRYTIHKSCGELIKVRQDNEKLDSITKEFEYVPAEFFSFTTGENVELNGWMMKPDNFDPEKQYPVFMYVYGGPGSQTVLDRWNAYNGAWFQMLTQKGYIVASVDNRGTGGRGEEFKKMTYLQLGKYETIDQIEAANYLASLEYTDSERIGIYGWSYGGYLTSLCLAWGSDIFNMAIAVAPVTTWRFYDTIYTERYMRTPQENPDGYDDNSPINHVDSIKGNYLIVHGTADDNVHYQHTVEMANALIETDVDFEMMVYPDHNHGIRGGNARTHLFKLMTDFILRTL